MPAPRSRRASRPGSSPRAVVYYLLRFDARALPGYLVTTALVDAAESAAVTGTRAGWMEFALLAAVSIAIGVAATRYLTHAVSRQRVTRRYFDREPESARYRAMWRSASRGFASFSYSSARL